MMTKAELDIVRMTEMQALMMVIFYEHWVTMTQLCEMFNNFDALWRPQTPNWKNNLLDPPTEKYIYKIIERARAIATREANPQPGVDDFYEALREKGQIQKKMFDHLYKTSDGHVTPVSSYILTRARNIRMQRREVNTEPKCRSPYNFYRPEKQEFKRALQELYDLLKEEKKEILAQTWEQTRKDNVFYRNYLRSQEDEVDRRSDIISLCRDLIWREEVDLK